MADETVDLNFIGAQLGKLLDGQRETNERLGELENGMSELQMAVAATRADLSIVKDGVAKIAETQQSHGARLNGIDSRLAIIEKHTGLVKA
jgi:hypothetical protein